MTRYRRVESLTADHGVATFDCGSEAQNLWLQRHALQAHRADTAKVYVICRRASREVVGYYALTAGSVSHEQVTPRMAKGIGRYPIAVVILTRLGVDRGVQGQGLGSELVRDALLQAALVAEQVGVRALVIHAETPAAAAFYRQISSAFHESPTDPLHLMLLMKDLRQMIDEAAEVRRELGSDEGVRLARSEAQKGEAMTSNAELVHLYWETCWNGRQVERLPEVFHDPYTHGRTPFSPTLMAGIVQETLREFPDMRVQVKETRVVEDAVITRSTFVGTHGGEIYGLPPTGKIVELPTLDVFFFREGKVWLYWHLTDHLPILTGIGAEVRLGDHVATWN